MQLGKLLRRRIGSKVPARDSHYVIYLCFVSLKENRFEYDGSFANSKSVQRTFDLQLCLFYRQVLQCQILSHSNWRIEVAFRRIQLLSLRKLQ
jgi:hypothetical protein